MIWVSGSFGSHVSCLYPDTVLRGDNSTCEFTGITFAGKGQCLDTGAKVEAYGKNTSININSKSISERRRGSGLPECSTYRTATLHEGAKGAIGCEYPDAG